MASQPTAPARVGDYRLERPLGQGGMARVYSARHVQTGTPVALKILDPASTTRRQVDAFLLEVRAMARLRHPHVVWIHDHGIVPEREAFAGAPWLAMEHCSGGDLRGRTGAITRWGTLRAVLTELLSALAHAHSAGVLHRDLKMSNVLFATPSDARPGLKLADFGIASVAGERAGDFGTPMFMAPELDHAVRHGPPADLYALGVLAWRVATGGWPFPETPIQLLHKHRTALNPFEPRFEVPDELERFLELLLRADPQQRPQTAADARQMLYSLGADGLDSVLSPTGRPLSRPIPPTIETVDPVLPAPGIGRGGSTLLDQRHLPLLGRIQQRTALWDGVVATEASGSPSMWAVVGPEGAGHTALAVWFVRSVREWSGARALYARRAERPGIAVLHTILAETLEVSDDVSWARVAEELRDHASSMDGASEAGGVVPPVEALARALERVAQGHLDLLPGAVVAALNHSALRPDTPRTTLLWLDGYLDPALRDFLDIADRELMGPVMIGVSGVEDPPGPVPAGQVLRLGPMGPSELGAALQHLLPLESDTAVSIAQECGGMPAVATKAVRRAIAVGAFELGRSGRYRLPGPLPEPEGLGSAGPLGLSDDQWSIVECAAAYGPRVRRWAVASVSRARWADLLLTEGLLVAQGALALHEDSWVLAPHLRRFALSRPDAPSWARLWADTLDEDDDPLVRIDAWIRAGEPHRAARLYDEERARIARWHGSRAEAAVVRACLDALSDVAPDEDLHGMLWAREIGSLAEVDDYTALARSRAEQATQRGWNRTAAECLLSGAFMQPIETKSAMLGEALELAPEGSLVRGKALHAIAFLHSRTGGQWRPQAEEALSILGDTDDEGAQLHALALNRLIATMDQDFDRAVAYARMAVDFVRSTHPAQLDLHLTLLADLELRRNRLEVAESLLEEAIGTAELCAGGTRIGLVLGNLLVIAGKREDWPQVDHLIVRLRASTHNPHLLGVAQVHQMLARLGRGDLRGAESALPEIERWLEGPHEAELDTVEALEHAVRLVPAGSMSRRLRKLAVQERRMAIPD